MKNWVSFLNERAPPVAYILLSFFPAVSGLKLAEGFVDFEKLGWGTTGLLVSLHLVLCGHFSIVWVKTYQWSGHAKANVLCI